jgi:hypothetical protein
MNPGLNKTKPMKTKTKSAPVCRFCGQSNGVQFAIFNPQFGAFGDACVACEGKAAKDIADVNAAHLAADYGGQYSDKVVLNALVIRATDTIKAGLAAGLIVTDGKGPMASFRFLAAKGGAK